ncbi:MAG TPA: Na/Pi cotransporter family protein [Candidatus Limadaptatus stercorigallinarum]|uniref:Na/Pi cotransporter family protein n=1 Tax=Candidatus Limadaptatus stercorigallinarum TaxID=2840845 RepID=A0A9D1L2M2_9FIRM|nr:Na/Pi cotransporter family protein [Candidatus Limadaptatus stercorigallinarum]
MQYAYAVFELLAGLGAFLIGVKLLSDNMEKLATTKMRNLFHRASGKAVLPEGATKKDKLRAKAKEWSGNLAGVGIGTVTTAIIQSSSLTTVMVVGLVNAGVMTLTQATTITMGANIGTTITAQIAALSAFDFATFAMGLTGIGVLIALTTKKEKVQTVCYAIAGLGLVFVGLDVMDASMEFFRESQVIVDLFASITNPFLLFFLGIAITAIVQSSSAITVILISMATQGIIIGGGGNAVMYVVLGTNIGTCVTALLSCIGTNINAKRAAVIHLLFNVIGSIIFFIIMICWPEMNAMTLEAWFPNNPGTQIAMFHTFFNIISTILFLPFTNGLVKLSELLVRPRKRDGKEEESVSSRLDKRLLPTPALAVDSATEEAADVLRKAVHTLNVAVDGFIAQDTSKAAEVAELNEEVDEALTKIDSYLVQISAYDSTLDTEKRVAALHSCLGDIHRVGELAQNVTKYTRRTEKDSLYFSPKVKDDVKDMFGLLEEMSEKAGKALTTGAGDLLAEVDDIENEIDSRRKRLIKEHVQRLGSGECRPESSGVFVNLVCNLERVGDHLNYIAHSVENS